MYLLRTSREQNDCHARSARLGWTSRYASVTFNQWGREFPMDGMNEAGLVVALVGAHG